MAEDFIIGPPSLSFSSFAPISNERRNSITSMFNVLFLNKSLIVFFSSDSSIVENHLYRLDIRGWSYKILWKISFIVRNINCFGPSKILVFRFNISSITVFDNNWLWNWIWNDNWDCVILLINWNITTRINATINNRIIYYILKISLMVLLDCLNNTQIDNHVNFIVKSYC